ncbi:TetR/AcrR family transcriptional regulator [Chryseolinea sp. T2]|uniref:TetR/AcrR family transcriptional regulator n=1 Tax=Chryseolinea sp. T2 TaxID=3129255 RepID=UPI003077F17F
MRDPEATRETILKKSGILFNTRGYKSTSISDITEATGYTKGAIYRHFESKVDLEVATLAHLSSLMLDKLRTCIKTETTAPAKLRAMFHFFESYITKPPLKGGCPLLNAAIEADDSHPALRRAALRILREMRDSIVRVLENGIRYNQLRTDIDVSEFATLMIASLEGAIMMSKLSGNDEDIKRVIAHLDKQVATLIR